VESQRVAGRLIAGTQHPSLDLCVTLIREANARNKRQSPMRIIEVSGSHEPAPGIDAKETLRTSERFLCGTFPWELQVRSYVFEGMETWRLFMAMRRSRKLAWRRSGSPIGRKGPRKAHPKYKRHSRESWTDADVGALRKLARANTPAGVISLKIGRTETAVRSKAHREGISLRPINRSPYSRRATAGR
jgi:hypothetical protein